jgi:hypothetical protein
MRGIQQLRGLIGVIKKKVYLNEWIDGAAAGQTIITQTLHRTLTNVT